MHTPTNTSHGDFDGTFFENRCTCEISLHFGNSVKMNKSADSINIIIIAIIFVVRTFHIKHFGAVVICLKTTKTPPLNLENLKMIPLNALRLLTLRCPTLTLQCTSNLYLT